MDRTGTVTGVKAGTATIRVRASSGSTASVQVEVIDPTDEDVLSTLTDCDQACLVRYRKGSLADFGFWERTEQGWQTVFACEAYVGRNGIDKTKEGDKRTPTGTYTLTLAFGIEPDPGALMEYHQVTETEYWCSNVKSPLYDRLVDTAVTDYRPTSADEHLIKVKGNYDYCLALDYNADHVPGKGSAIFLHCQGKKRSTSGCIAIPTERMKELLRSLRPGGRIAIFR